MLTVSIPVIEHHRDPLGIGEARPRLSWRITEAPPGWRQRAAVITIRRSGSERSFTIPGPEQVLVPWPDAPLASREQAHVRVAVIGEDDERSADSGETTLETGLLHPADWTAVPVGAPIVPADDLDARRPALVRRSFHLDAPVRRARLYATAHGVFEAELNGSRVGDELLAPGWTAYQHRLRYRTHDVTALLSPGENVIGAWLGDGWYRGRMGWYGGFHDLYGSDQSLVAQLEIELVDGRRLIIATDDTWSWAPSPIIRTGNYDGEDHDGREEQEGWSAPGADPTGWHPVVTFERDPATLVAPTGPPVRVTERVAPIAVLTSPAGTRILDLGQNLVGRMRLHATAPRGTTVTLRTAEVLQDGEIYTRPLRTARSTDSYTFAGRADGEEWAPRFTFHGFRYVEVTGWPGDLDADVAAGALVAEVMHTDLERTGWFACSDPLLTRLHENVVWGMRGNFVDIPTDCPQRDERVGWTGDIQVFGPTAATLFDVSGMLGGWLRDVAAEQLPDGTIPWYVPVIPAHRMWTPIRPGAAWGDVATLLPTALHDRYADTGLVADQFHSARRWVDRVAELAGPDRLWNEGFQLGDWLDPAAPPQDPADARTDRYLVATAYFARSARAVADLARILGRQEEERSYRALADEVAAAFRTAYVDADGRMTSDAQTAYALAIRFDLLPDAEQRSHAGARLAGLVAEAEGRIATGFVGTPLILDALTATGQLDAAYRLLLTRECPSWLYQVEQGATTIWERWDAMLPDGTVNPGTMTSFNHYALGAVADWMHRTVAGLALDTPGGRTLRFAPRPGGGLTWARSTQLTAYGEAAIAWTHTDGVLAVTVTVPVGADAVLDVPGRAPEFFGHGTHTVEFPFP
ncbi:family 78 glycoside hydrolase catalytic domain [Microbacterium gorillae]|uniref:family 78 glycoside hydrolase catalytic domain n=1 Tax=Microbacterium gorillae TaxID=1231063 RepID=UPI003D98A8CF